MGLRHFQLRACAVAAGLTAALALLAAPGPAYAGQSATPWQVGAALADTTPPAFNAGADAARFPNCPAATFTGPRLFAFSEPYVDSDNNQEFSYSGVGQDAVPELYCDANLNGRYDGLYLSGGIDHQAKVVHDPIDARAIAISDGTKTAVIVSLVAQGLFENYSHAIRTRVHQLRPQITDLVVSANHNESSPDTVGIYGAPDAGGVTGANSGIDDYYMDFVVEQVSQAAVAAYDDMQPASLGVSEFPIPEGLDVRLSHNFPTTDDARNPAAIDPKIRVLQALDAQGGTIATVMNLAAHNQEIGHSGPLGREISSDWPGYFHDDLEQRLGGVAMFLVGDNGSEEDPETVPPVDQTQFPECSNGCYAQAEATGKAFAAAVAAHADQLDPLAPGPVDVKRDEFFVPLENNLFKAAAAAGLFGPRQTYQNGVPAGRAGNELLTEVDLVNIGPDLQFLGNPGEAFPALMIGSPWGIEDAGCPERPNPPVPTWHAGAEHRFQIGLANDMIGYELPPWAYSSLPGAFLYQGAPATCVNDGDDKDPAGHQHKLETEGVGATGSKLVAEHLTGLLDQQPDPTAKIRRGRFVYADGTLSRRAQRPDATDGTENAVAVWIASAGSDTLEPGTGRIIALDGIGAFGSRLVDEAGSFMDYDGQAQATPDITTRGMSAPGTPMPTPVTSGDPVAARYYLDVYPALASSPLGRARGYCDDTRGPDSTIDAGRLHAGKRHLHAAGSSTDAGCPGGNGKVGRPGEVASVAADVSRRFGKRHCAFLGHNGHLSDIRSCANPIELPAEGTRSWRLSLKPVDLPDGRYRLRVRATDTAGNVEHRGPGHDPANVLRFRVG